MYAGFNFKTKKALIEAVKAGREVRVYQPGGISLGETDGSVCIEGPHFPEPHRWYASAVIKDSVVVSVK